MAEKKHGEVRQQVATLLGAAQQGEFLELQKFLADYAHGALMEERREAGLGPGDDSDEDDYPAGHFKDAPGGKKPKRADRLAQLQRDALRDFKDGNGRTALHFAASSNAAGTDATAKAILALFPLAHALRDDNGATPLILAAEVPGRGVAAQLVELLLAHGADVAAADKLGVQAMHHAAAGGRAAVVKLLHARGAPLDVRSGSGTPLHWAAGEGQAAAVIELLELGAPVDATNAQVP
jgi:ankyrin repeat protein